MNVLQVSKYYYPEVGGLEQVVRAFAAGLNGPEYTMRVLAATPRGRGRTETIDGVRVRKAACLGELSSTPIAPLFPVELAAAGRTADVLHFHLPNPAAVVSQLSLGPTDPKVVVTYHSDIVKQAAALRLYRPLLHQFLERADRIVTTSPRLLDRSPHLAPHAEKCTVVPLSIDLEEYRDPLDDDAGNAADGRSAATDSPAGVDSPTGTEPPSDTDRPPGFDLPIDPDRSTVLFVGRLSYYKGVEYLLDAMGGVDATLLVVGDGEQRAALERRTREREGVAFLGRVSDATLKRCYAAADVFVLPSVAPSEAFGIVQLEAMAHGTPIVNTALPTGVPWVSKDGKTGLTVPPKDADALADAIERLLANPDLRRQYGENARERVHRRFSRETMLDAMAAVYEDVTE
jgi:rhamnosyl/mannosyltransferase